MNKFRANLHPAFFDGIETRNGQDVIDNGQDLADRMEEQRRRVLEQSRIKEDVLKDAVRRNNDALASSLVETKEEKEQTDEEVSKLLEKQLKQLAKNKKIDLPWTDNEWKCSRAEKRLATSSAKVFQELLGGNPWKLAQMIEKCKSKNWELTDQEAEERKKQLRINSKTKDIQNFYKAFKEYQNPQSQFQHLKNLMWFFCESDFENKRDLREALEVRSEKISKQDINNAWKMLYQEWWKTEADGTRRYVIIDNRTGEEIDGKPKDWKLRASFEVIKNRLSKENSTTNKMLTLLWDFNLDGEVNSGDVGTKTGTQVVDIFRRAVATKHLEDASFDDDAAVKNIVDYANKFGMDIQNVQTVDQLYQWMTDNKNWYENTKSLQNFLKRLPIELDDVISNWTEAWKRSLDRMVSAINLEAQERELATLAAKDKAKEIVSAGEAQLKEVIKDDRERADIAQQLLDQLPSMLISKATEQQRWLAVWTAVSLDQIIKWMSGGFNVGVGSDGKPTFWLFLWWDRRFNLSDRTQLQTAISWWAKLLFIPCAATSMEISRDTNKGRRNKDLDATGEHRISLWWNVAITWWIFSYGFSAGIENKKDVGIEKQAQNINKVLKKQAKSWVESLKSATDKKASLREALKTEFPKTSEEELDAATDNLLSIIQQFKIDEQSTDSDFDVYAQVIADVYAEQWKNAALAWIADNKRKISWWKVWIQFIAWCVPIVTLVAKFTKYRNARTNESEHSRIARIDAQVNGTGNEIVSLWDSKEIWSEKIAQINEILKRYGATSELKYIAWVDGKPGRIQIPVAVSDGIWINIRVSESLKWCVKEEQNTYLFPANAAYRLLQETGGNQRSITLNIGSDKSSLSDVMISDAEGMKKLLGDKELTWAKKLEYKDPISESIEYNPDIDSLFTTDVVEWLKTIDSSNRRKFSEFMRTKRDSLENFGEMITALKNVLWKNKKYEAILKQLDDENVSNEDKQLIIDRIMAISAYANVHDKKWLDQNVRHRGDYYRRETMIGSNWQSIFDKLNIKRDDILSDIQDYNPVFKPNLLWATAFYHKNNTAKWLALTWLGATNVLWGTTKALDGEDKSKAEEWFLWWNNEKGDYVPWVLSAEKSPAEWSNLKRALKGKLPEGTSLSDENLKKLLKWEEIEFTLDNSQKKVKVKLDVKYVFYLMWECANESLGIELWNLQVQEQHEVDDYSQWSLYLNNGEGTSVISVSKKNVAFGISFGWWKEEEEEEEEKKPEYKDGSDPSDWKDGTIPEQEGHPIGEWEQGWGDGQWDGQWDWQWDWQWDDIWTEWEQGWGDGPGVDDGNQGDL